MTALPATQPATPLAGSQVASNHRIDILITTTDKKWDLPDEMHVASWLHSSTDDLPPRERSAPPLAIGPVPSTRLSTMDLESSCPIPRALEFGPRTPTAPRPPALYDTTSTIRRLPQCAQQHHRSPPPRARPRTASARTGPRTTSRAQTDQYRALPRADSLALAVMEERRTYERRRSAMQVAIDMVAKTEADGPSHSIAGRDDEEDEKATTGHEKLDRPLHWRPPLALPSASPGVFSSTPTSDDLGGTYAQRASPTAASCRGDSNLASLHTRCHFRCLRPKPTRRWRPDVHLPRYVKRPWTIDQVFGRRAADVVAPDFVFYECVYFGPTLYPPDPSDVLRNNHPSMVLRALPLGADVFRRPGHASPMIMIIATVYTPT
ncbi:hypothetical protein K438DRAFT_1983537 [Mycena galopus ATCC 62051]|nr:hypothetical protein K438DRAFT_1983537 [Mycena galopus ATCC 62051]